MKRFLTLMMVLVLMFAVSGCAQETAQTPAEDAPAPVSDTGPGDEAAAPGEEAPAPLSGDGEVTIVFSVKTPSNDTFQTALAASIQSAVEEAGGQFILMGAGNASNVATQVTQLEDVINRGWTA